MTEPTPATAPDGATVDTPVRPNVIIGVIVVAAFVMILNETILSVALHDLSVDLGVPATTVQWLTSGFLLTMAVVIPITGFLLERFTPRRIYLASLALFSAGTLVSALAPGFAVLLVGRVIQASGTAVMIPLLMTTIMRLVDPKRRGATMGTITIVIAVAPAIGPTIGGAVLATLGWRWMFWIVLPLALAVLALGAAILRVTAETRRVPLDVLSVALSAVGFGSLLYGLSTVGGDGPALVPPWAAIVGGAVVLVTFVLRQRALQREERALLDLRPFADRSFVVCLVLAALLFMTLIGAGAILLPLFLLTVLNAGTFATGLAVLPGGLVLGLLGRPVGAVFDRLGARPLVIPGAFAVATALWLFAALGAGSPILAVVAIHVLLMAGLGLMLTPLMTGGLATLPGHLYSHGSAILATLQQVAGAFGTAAFVTVAALGSAAGAPTPDATGLRLAFMAAGVVAVLALVTSLFLPRGTTQADASDGPTADGDAADEEVADGPTADGVAVDDRPAVSGTRGP